MPGVIMLGTDSPISLGIIRELGRHGVPVHGIGGEYAIGRASRYLASFETRAQDHRSLLTQLKSIATARPAAFVMTVAETDIDFLNRHREALLPLRPLVANSAAFDLAVTKEKTITMANAAGIAVPKTLHPGSSSISELLLAENWSFPVVLKWSDPNIVRDSLAQHGLPLDKAIFCFSADEVEKYLSQFDPIEQYPLVQEYVRGVGLGHFIYMHHGEALQTFQHLRLREWPPEGGTSTACRSLAHDAHPQLLQSSINLLRSLQWEGVAMVEYRYDAATGKAVFMEVNGRFWGSFPLAVASRAGFAYLQYRVMGLGRIERPEPPKPRITCRFMIPEIKWMIRILFQRGKISDPMFQARPIRRVLSFCGDFLRPGSCYYIFAWDDPKPFFKDLGNLLRTLVGRLRPARN